MRKIRKYVFLVGFLISCSSAEITIQRELIEGFPKTILLCEIENRMFDFNPHAVKNFSDALLFEFTRLGYAIKRAPSACRAPAEMLKAENADLMIVGSMFEGRFGDAIEDRLSAATQLMQYEKDGN
ncbi:MAG: hypothetical protein N2316_10610 [Spirochaetes bacterium]|nr:hypothetical protein [Spirochaetota bacterium]